MHLKFHLMTLFFEKKDKFCPYVMIKYRHDDVFAKVTLHCFHSFLGCVCFCKGMHLAYMCKIGEGCECCGL